MEEFKGTTIIWCPKDHSDIDPAQHSVSLKIVKEDSGDVETWYTLECPVCNHKVVIEVHP